MSKQSVSQPLEEYSRKHQDLADKKEVVDTQGAGNNGKTQHGASTHVTHCAKASRQAFQKKL